MAKKATKTIPAKKLSKPSDTMTCKAEVAETKTSFKPITLENLTYTDTDTGQISVSFLATGEPKKRAYIDMYDLNGQLVHGLFFNTNSDGVNEYGEYAREFVKKDQSYDVKVISYYDQYPDKKYISYLRIQGKNPDNFEISSYDHQFASTTSSFRANVERLHGSFSYTIQYQKSADGLSFEDFGESKTTTNWLCSGDRETFDRIAFPYARVKVVSEHGTEFLPVYVCPPADLGTPSIRVYKEARNNIDGWNFFTEVKTQYPFTVCGLIYTYKSGDDDEKTSNHGLSASNENGDLSSGIGMQKSVYNRTYAHAEATVGDKTVISETITVDPIPMPKDAFYLRHNLEEISSGVRNELYINAPSYEISYQEYASEDGVNWEETVSSGTLIQDDETQMISRLIRKADYEDKVNYLVKYEFWYSVLPDRKFHTPVIAIKGSYEKEPATFDHYDGSENSQEYIVETFIKTPNRYTVKQRPFVSNDNKVWHPVEDDKDFEILSDTDQKATTIISKEEYQDYQNLFYKNWYWYDGDYENIKETPLIVIKGSLAPPKVLTNKVVPTPAHLTDLMRYAYKNGEHDFEQLLSVYPPALAHYKKHGYCVMRESRNSLYLRADPELDCFELSPSPDGLMKTQTSYSISHRYGNTI